MSDEPSAGPRPLRAVALILLKYLLRILRESRETTAMDIQMSEVLWTVVAATYGEYASVRQFDRQILHDEEVPASRFRSISRMAISRSTGLNRETVRRAVNRLLAEGFLVATATGVALSPHNLRRPEVASFWRFAERQFEMCSLDLDELDRHLARIPSSPITVSASTSAGLVSDLPYPAQAKSHPAPNG